MRPTTRRSRELAHAHDIKVIYSLGASGAQLHRRSRKIFLPSAPPEKILALNRWLKNYCASANNGCIYLDYFSAMVDDKGLLKKDLADDGLHPNAAGFKIMAPLAEAAIEKALASPKP